MITFDAIMWHRRRSRSGDATETKREPATIRLRGGVRNGLRRVKWIVQVSDPEGSEAAIRLVGSRCDGVPKGSKFR